MNFGTMFSGGEGAGVGLQAAGLRHAWGIEYDPAIAAVAQANGFDVRVADVRDVDYAALSRVDWLHASPVCTRASVANPNAGETADDISMAAAVVRALKAQEPEVFTLENVWRYRTFKAFRLICDELGRQGYFWTYDHINTADFAVPQTRRRLILRASRGLLPLLPMPVPWVGWYAAIEDLIPTLPESRLAPWQLARLPEELRGAVLVGGGNTQMAQIDSKSRAWHEPMFTVTGNTKMGDNRAVLIAKTADKFGDGHRQSSEPAQTIGANEHGSKAVLVAGLLNSDSTKLTRRAGGEPSFTVTTSHNQKDVRAVLLDMHNAARDATVRGANEPCSTQGSSMASRPSHQLAVLPTRVVSMTPRCLARFQSVPDDYRLPGKRTLAAKVIGNMVPPLLMQRIAENMLEALAWKGTGNNGR